MRILAIGDIHGCSAALDTLLAAVEVQPEDQLVTLGDYVDRGPDTAGVLERLINLHNTGRLIALRGNHEWMMVHSRNRNPVGWLISGGKAALASYAHAGQAGSLDDVPAHHWDFLENRLIDLYEADTHFFVHASADPNLPFSEQQPYKVLWEKFENPEPHFSGKIMVCGHTQQRSGVPLNVGHAICIDTSAYNNGWLTCLDVTTGKVWQANQLGAVRTAMIDDYLVSY
jgi:serine/threonine protein phosphatase 1